MIVVDLEHNYLAGASPFGLLVLRTSHLHRLGIASGPASNRSRLASKFSNVTSRP